jgi:hypothetical protein
MDPISFAGAYEGLKAAKSLLGIAIDAKVDAESKSRIMEAQGKLGDVQDTLFTLRERLSELQQERDSLRSELSAERDWLSKAGQYELAATLGTAVVYKFKGEPDHLACPSCFNKREVHILQLDSDFFGTYKCTGRGSSFPIKQTKRISPTSSVEEW